MKGNIYIVPSKNANASIIQDLVDLLTDNARPDMVEDIKSMLTEAEVVFE